MAVTYTIAGKEFELYYNVKAMREIEQTCGDISKMYEWMLEGSTIEQLYRTVKIFQILVNGGTYKHNCEIALGMKDGEKRPFFTDDEFACLFSTSDIPKITEKLIEAMGGEIPIETPDAVQAEQEDPDLAEVESYRKESTPGNQQTGAGTPGSGFWSAGMQ